MRCRTSGFWVVAVRKYGWIEEGVSSRRARGVSASCINMAAVGL